MYRSLFSAASPISRRSADATAMCRFLHKTMLFTTGTQGSKTTVGAARARLVKAIRLQLVSWGATRPRSSKEQETATLLAEL